MTVQDLMITALALMGEPADAVSDYQSYAVTAVNIVLSETLPLENQLREVKREEPLTQAPKMKELMDIIPYDTHLLMTCLSYGVAAKLTMEDDDPAKLNYLNGMYMQAFAIGTPGLSHPICDSVWGGSDR